MNICDRYGSHLRYLRISRGPQRGKYVHQLIAEAMLGRALFSFEQVDHIDGNTLNNDPSNLKVVHASEHARVGNRRRLERYNNARSSSTAETAPVES